MNILVEKNTRVVAYAFNSYEITGDNIIVDNVFVVTRFVDQFDLINLPDQVIPDGFHYGSHVLKDNKLIQNPNAEKYEDAGARITQMQNSIAENFIDHEFRISNIELGL